MPNSLWPHYCSWPSSSVHGILQATILEWVAIPRNQTGLCCIAGRFFTIWATEKPPSVQFSHSVLSDSLRPHGLHHARPPCPSPTPAVYSNSCPLSQWCHPTISSSEIAFSSSPQSFLASGSFPWVSSSHQVAKVLEFQIQHQSFQWTFRTDFL